MENQDLQIAKNSRLPIITVICAFLILFFEFCTINVIGGEFAFTYRFPLHFGGSLFDLSESAVVVCIPVFMLMFTLLYAKKNLKMLCWPLVIFVVRVLVQTTYLWIYEGHFSLKDTGPDLAVYLLLLLIFALTVFGRIRTKWWLVGICGIFIIIGIAKLFIPTVSYTFVVGISFYLSTFLSYTLFFVGYGALGLAIRKSI